LVIEVIDLRDVPVKEVLTPVAKLGF